MRWFVLTVLCCSVFFASPATDAASAGSKGAGLDEVWVGNKIANPKLKDWRQEIFGSPRTRRLDYGDRGFGACGGYCNDIRPEYRTQCKNTQRPLYNENGYCLCGYFKECGG